MSKGWIKLHRKILDSRVFANEGLLKVWVYCLCRANHQTNYVDIKTGKGKTEVEVSAGDFIFGRHSASRDLNMNPSTLYKRMQKLQDIGNINIQSNSHYSVVSVCNWETYQDSENREEQPKEQASNNQVTGREQASNTDKNVNNDKNDKKNHKSVGTNGTDFPDSCEYLDEAKDIAQYLLESIIEYDPTHKYANNSPSINSWVLDIERAMRLDGRTKEQLEFIIDYIYKVNGKHSHFWAGNVESGKKLRKHFDKIKSQIKQDMNNGKQRKQRNINSEAAKL